MQKNIKLQDFHHKDAGGQCPPRESSKSVSAPWSLLVTPLKSSFGFIQKWRFEYLNPGYGWIFTHDFKQLSNSILVNPGSSWAAWDSCGDSTWEGRGAAVLEHVPEIILHVQRHSKCFPNADIITHSWQPQPEQSISQNLMSCNLLAVARRPCPKMSDTSSTIFLKNKGQV